MNNTFSYTNANDIKYMQQTSLGFVRILHAVPDAPNVDIYANGKMVAQNIAFGQLTRYLPIPEGNYTIALYVTGKTDSPVLQNTLRVTKDMIMTIAAAGTLNEIGLIGIPDACMNVNTGKAMIRFMHLSPNAPAVDITLPDGTVLFNNVSFKHLTEYIMVDPRNYTLQVRLAGRPTVVLTVPNVALDENMAYTVYALGLVGQTPELQALLATDGITMTSY